LEPWEKVLIDGENYPDNVHGQIACQDCHNGIQSADKAEAHTNLIARPSNDPQAVCGDCHPNILETIDTSLHNNLQGYWTVLDQRTVPEDHEAISEMFGNHCASCHATCGDCHVSQPNMVGGGFIDGHNFNKTPSLTRNCTACHGSRVGNEYLGKHEGLNPDVHFRQGRMTCVDCHTGHEMHGQPATCEECHVGPEAQMVEPANHRYAGVQSPRCETCHITAAINQDDIEMHRVHAGDLSCQVCHSVAYSNCYNCHVAISDATGNPFYATESTEMDFKIGRNPIKTFDRPYDFVPLRHVPVATDSFSFYGENLLPNFNALPTWTYTTPHNIQRETPQTESCDACHGNADLFLTADQVKPEELEANLSVIMESVPPLTAELDLSISITATGLITAANTLTNTEGSP
jgi:hypothetical protein